MAFEMALKKDKPMIMSDEDMKHFNTMFTGCNEKFKNSREACSMIIEGAYLSDIHIDFFNCLPALRMIKPNKSGIGLMISDLDADRTVHYHVYNAISKDLYDVVLEMTESPDGIISVKLIRPSNKETSTAKGRSNANTKTKKRLES